MPKMKIFSALGRRLRSLATRHPCVFCLTPATDYGCCAACRAEMPRIEHFCRRCAVPLTGDKEWLDLCADCLRGKSHLDSAWSAFHYDYPLRRALHHFKFNRQLYYGSVLGRLWVKALPPPLVPDILLPVPLHKKRLRLRGFNPAYELAKPFAAYFSLPLRDDICRRIRDTQPQLSCPPDKRSLNVRGAFQLNRNGYAELRGKAVLILDDVMTTGATVQEIARVLKTAGVGQVAAWSLLRS